MNTENTTDAAITPRKRMALRKEMEHPETGAIATYFVPRTVSATFDPAPSGSGKTDVVMAGYVSQSAYLMAKAPLLNLSFSVQSLPTEDLMQFALLHAERVTEFSDAVVVYEPQAEPIPAPAPAVAAEPASPIDAPRPTPRSTPRALKSIKSQ